MKVISAKDMRDTMLQKIKEVIIPDEELHVSVTDPHRLGGQHVGTYSGATVTHLPTGIIVTVNAERSQHRNRAIAIDAILGALTSPHFKG